MVVGKKRRTKEYDAKYYYFFIKLWAFIVLRVRARTKKNPSKRPAFSTFRRSDFPTTFQKRRPFDDQRQKKRFVDDNTFCRKASINSIIFKIAKSVSSFHDDYSHVKKKPCLNVRDKNPKPLDKDRDTTPGLEEQSSRRPGQ